jgi:hypothetical protein
MSMTDLVKGIRSLERTATVLYRETPTDEELADAIGDVRAVEVKLASTRNRWESLTEEMEPIADHDPTKRVDPTERTGVPVATGERWEVKPTFTTKRSYNTQRIIVDLGKGIEEMTGSEMSTGKLLLLLKERDALRITWQWTNLKSMFHALGVTLVTGPEELDDEAVDLDDPHVGEWKKKTGVKRVPLKEEK